MPVGIGFKSRLCFAAAVFFLFLGEAGATPVTFNVPAQAAGDALLAFSKQAGLDVLFSYDALQKVRANQVVGRFEPDDALSLLLQNTGFVAGRTKNGKYAVAAAGDSAEARAARVTQTGAADPDEPAPINGNAGANSNSAPNTANPSNTASPSEAAGSGDQTVVLDPFTVNVTSTGYSTDQTMSGSRTVQSLSDIPLSVGIINAEQLNDIHAVDSHEAVTYGAPGVSSNTRVSDDYNIRGFRTEFVLEDGVTITQTEEKELYDIDRVEIIRGPIATTLGSNGSDFLGGVINFVTRQPTATPQGFVNTTFGNFDYYRLEANASGPLYKDEDLDSEYRVTIGGTKATPEKAAETLDEHFIGGGLKVLLGQGRKSELDLSGSWFQSRNYLYYEDFLNYNSYYRGSTMQLNPYSTPSFSPTDPANSWYKYSKFVVEGIYKAELTEHTHLRLLLTETGAKDRRMIIRGITIEPDNVTLERQAIPFETYKYFATAMLDIVNHHDLGFVVNDFSYGLEDDDTAGTQWQQVYTAPPINVLAPNFSQDYLYTVRNYFAPPNGTASQNRANNFAGYAEDNMSFLNDRLIIVGGVRWIDTRASTINYVTNVFTDKSTGRESTHKYGAVFKPIKGVSLYYSQGTDFIPLTGFLITGASEAPEIGEDSEWGVKLDYTLNSQFSVYGTVTHFDTQLTNAVISISEMIGGTLLTGNGQNAENTTAGYEAEFGGRLGFGPGHADFVASYYNAMSNTAGSVLPAQDAVPWSYSFLGKYTFTEGDLRGFMFGGGVYDEGKRLELTYSYVETPVTIMLMSTYQINKNWSCHFNVYNLTNRYYIAAAAATGLVETAPTRQIQGGVKYSW